MSAYSLTTLAGGGAASERAAAARLWRTPGRYHHVAAALNAIGASVFAPDRAGHGRPAGERVCLEDMAAVVSDAHRVANALTAAGPLAVVGYPMGGMIATRYVQRVADDGAARVLSGPLPGRCTAVGDLLALTALPDAPLDVTTLSRDPQVVAGIIRPIRGCGAAPLGGQRCRRFSGCG
ncbi:alpha/beta fold hydrolase [Pantoea sp. 1.19]|uniref:alpha/beta fold hydrolase n=1 Tax=Pantoea sp. 1.19 TaxID=1925589 RepID=UPI00210F56A5|nr:alpha/beta fold hydrolase [Pantoea sp. 1.19]